MRNKMRVIQGASEKEMLTSIDGILDGLLKKQGMMQVKLNKRNKEPLSFNISNFIETCSSGSIICSYFSLADIDIEKAVLHIGNMPKEKDLFVAVKIVSKEGTENIVRANIKQGLNSIDDVRRINKGDRLSVAIEYLDEEIAPKGIWVAMRGEYR